jgi:hypothetical protein
MKCWPAGISSILPIPSLPVSSKGEIMAVSREQIIRLVAEKVGPSIALEAKMEKGTWRVTLTREGKTSLLELKRGFIEDYLEKGEYQQEMAFEARINKAIKALQ